VSDAWRTIIASALDWEQAHVSFDGAVAHLPRALRGLRPEALPHSPWELVEHIRITQRDLVAFMDEDAYEELEWPTGYWPASPEPPSEDAWDEAIAAVGRDRSRLAEIAAREGLELTAPIPRGTGQTYLRTILVAIDHTAYHVGQIVTVRRLLGAWPPG
jgi:uncharacterized damage-inducible protein DinB